MHAEITQFIERAKLRFPDKFSNPELKILDVGSLDINGNNRHFFKGQYWGIDIGTGPNVDEVIPVHQFGVKESWDVIICTEMLEHDQHWKESLRRLTYLIKPGGLVIITCAGPQRPEHGTRNTSPIDSPYTQDYYRNLSKSDLILNLSIFGYWKTCLMYRRNRQDLMFWGIRI